MMGTFERKHAPSNENLSTIERGLISQVAIIHQASSEFIGIHFAITAWDCN